MITERIFKFRIWNKFLLKWMGDEWIPYNQHINDIFTCNEDCVFQQYTGIKDKSKKEIYEGDIIKFKYFVGDFAWESMSEEDAKYQETMVNKQYIGVIHSSIVPVNLDIICGNPENTHMIFPLLYASKSKIIGNIFETPELMNYPSLNG